MFFNKYIIISYSIIKRYEDACYSFFKWFTIIRFIVLYFNFLSKVKIKVISLNVGINSSNFRKVKQISIYFVNQIQLSDLKHILNIYNFDVIFIYNNPFIFILFVKRKISFISL